MIVYSRKIFRKQTGNFTFVVVTDRDDLDGQILPQFPPHEHGYRSRSRTTERQREMLGRFVGQNKRLIFTLIHKFRWEKGKEYPLLSDRDDIIVIACKPEILGNAVVRSVAAFQYLRGVVDSIIEQMDIDAVSVRISACWMRVVVATIVTTEGATSRVSHRTIRKDLGFEQARLRETQIGV